jgi:uncharacterized membrane protein (DUF373 family)
MMAVVLGLATIDLAWILLKDIIQPPISILSVEQLLELFGMLMPVVIGIELPETIIRTYLTQGQPGYEVVLSVAIIAIARKVMIPNLKGMDRLTLIGIASIVAALTGGDFLMKTCQTRDRQTCDVEE